MIGLIGKKLGMTRTFQEDGRVAWHLGWRDAEAARALGATIPDSAVGVAVVVAEDGTVVTAVRSPNRHRLRVRRTRRPRGVR